MVDGGGSGSCDGRALSEGGGSDGEASYGTPHVAWRWVYVRSV